VSELVNSDACPRPTTHRPPAPRRPPGRRRHHRSSHHRAIAVGHPACVSTSTGRAIAAADSAVVNSRSTVVGCATCVLAVLDHVLPDLRAIAARLGFGRTVI
jgi:hypothetical protein